MQVIKPAITGQCPAPTWEQILFLVQKTRTPAQSWYILVKEGGDIRSTFHFVTPPFIHHSVNPHGEYLLHSHIHLHIHMQQFNGFGEIGKYTTGDFHLLRSFEFVDRSGLTVIKCRWGLRTVYYILATSWSRPLSADNSFCKSVSQSSLPLRNSISSGLDSFLL